MEGRAGQGATERFLSFAGILGMEIAGRSLPPGKHLGARILALRMRTGMSRSSLCDASGSSRTTILWCTEFRRAHNRFTDEAGERILQVVSGRRPYLTGVFFFSAAQTTLDRLRALPGAWVALAPAQGKPTGVANPVGSMRVID